MPTPPFSVAALQARGYLLFLDAAQAARLESAERKKLQCATCSGAGEREVSVCGHSGCCPCAGEDVPCEDCDGTGKERCLSCGEASTVAIAGESRKEHYCTGCAVELWEDAAKTGEAPAWHEPYWSESVEYATWVDIIHHYGLN